jgi:drug/metabolite transporter (DMT)-like permease
MNDRTAVIPSIPLLALVFIAFLCILFGANTVAIKISLSGLGVFTTAGIRFSLSALTILAWAIFTRQPIKIKKGQVHQLLIISAIFFIQLSLFYIGLSKTHASRGTLMANIQPFFVLFLAHFFIPGDQITKRKLLGILLGFAGMAFVFLDKKGISSELKIGDLIILGAAFTWACNGVYTKKILADLQPFQVVLYPTLLSGPLFLITGFLSGEIMVIRLDYSIVFSVSYQGLVATSFGFVAWNTMLQKYGAVSLHSFIFLLPVSGVVLGGIVLGEPITTNIALALLLIVTGILIVNMMPKKPAVPTIIHPGRNV